MIVVTVIPEDEVEPVVFQCRNTWAAEQLVARLHAICPVSLLTEIHEGGKVIADLDDVSDAADGFLVTCEGQVGPQPNSLLGR